MRTSDSLDGLTISGADLCSLTGLTDRRHRQMAEEGYFPAPSKGRYGLAATIRGILAFNREQMERQGDSLKAEQQKLTRVRREKAELERDLLSKELIRRDEIGPLLRNFSVQQRAILQFKIEQQLAPNLAGKTAAEAIEQARECVDDVCRIIREGLPEWLNANTPGPAPELPEHVRD